MIRRIALIAGAGRLPIIFADEAKKEGVEVVAFAVKGLTAPELEKHVSKIYWDEITQGEQALKILRDERINQVVMTGKVPKAILFDKKLTFDEMSTSLLKDTIDKKDYAVLKLISSHLNKIGIKILDSTMFFKNLLLHEKGVLTIREPTAQEWENINYGKKLAKRLADLDVGQTVIVKDKTVLAIEGIEGTDEAIKRSGKFGGKDAIIVKVSRPKQDMRFDVPTIGPETIDSIIESEGRVLAIEAKSTIVVDKEDLIEKANRAGISVVAI